MSLDFNPEQPSMCFTQVTGVQKLSPPGCNLSPLGIHHPDLLAVNY